VSWFAHSANETEAGNEHVGMFVAVDFDFPSGHIYLWTGLGDLSFGGNDYLGVGDLGKIDTPAENNQLQSQTKKYQLTGVDPALVPETDIDNSYGRSVTEYFGFLDAEARTLVATPEINWEGRIDVIRRVDGANPVIEVTAEHRMVLLELTDTWRYTHEHQQMFYPALNDKGFDQVTAIQLKKVVWSGKNVDPAVQMPAFPTHFSPRR